MNFEKLEFTIEQWGKEIEYTILSLIPKNNIESYVVFANGEKDSDDNIIFKYGLLKKYNDEYKIYQFGLERDNYKRAMLDMISYANCDTDILPDLV